MEAMRPRKETACALCGNVDDLYGHAGKLYCIQCLTCPHGEFRAPSTAAVCPACFRNYYSVWTFTGPIIPDLKGYFLDAAILGIDALTWSYRQEDEFQKLAHWSAVQHAKSLGLDLSRPMNRLFPYIHLFPRR